MDPNDSMWNETKNEEDMMKKVIAVLVTLVVATGLLCACGVNQAGNEGSNQEQQIQQHNQVQRKRKKRKQTLPQHVP